MKYRQFGKIDYKVSALGLGAMRFPSKLNPFDPRVDEKEAIRMVRNAIDMGINYIDTAWPYHFGASEKILGKALQNGYREKVFLVTKLPVYLVKETEDFKRFFEQQLNRLQTDYIDCYLFHALTETTFENTKRLNLIKEMEQERKNNRIRYIGFSFHDTLPVFKNIVDYYDWDLAQIQYNYLDTTLQAGTEGLEYAYSKGMAITIMEPLKGGMLANPPKEVHAILNSSGVERTPVDWALQFLWNRPEVSVVLSGMSNMDQIQQNIESADRSGINSLSQHEIETIDSIVGEYEKRILVPCTACQYCMPCPYGVNIPENFAIANASNSKPNNLFDRLVRFLIKRKYKKLEKRKERVKSNGRASLCVSCGKCLPLCPQSIDIPKQLEKVHQYLANGHKPELLFKG